LLHFPFSLANEILVQSLITSKITNKISFPSEMQHIKSELQNSSDAIIACFPVLCLVNCNINDNDNNNNNNNIIIIVIKSFKKNNDLKL